MPWCPKCKTEYREGFERCNDCETDLVDKLADEPVADKPQEYEAEAFLVSAGSDMQADILESKLKFYGIPVVRKYRENGGYLKVYMGATPFGIDLYVPARLLADARELIENKTGIIEGKDDSDPIAANNEGDPDAGVDEYSSKRQRAKVLSVILFFIPLLIWIAYEFVLMVMKLLNRQL